MVTCVQFFYPGWETRYYEDKKDDKKGDKKDSDGKKDEKKEDKKGEKKPEDKKDEKPKVTKSKASMKFPCLREWSLS